MKSSRLFLSIWLLAFQPTCSLAYWRMACSVSQTARIDPILNPGEVSAHAHKFAGGSNVNQYSDFTSLQSSTCSSCEVQKDTSAYWTPQLYYAHTNGDFEEVPNYGMTVYYVGRGGNASDTVPFPAGFKMLTGDTRQRSYDNSTLTYLDTRPVADRVSFRCINEANDIPETHYISDTDCVNGLRAQVNFQSCWDGVNTYLDNSAHVDYLSGIDYGVCPPTHPVSIPGLFFEVLYMVNDIDQSSGGQFVFSNGDPTGFGFHGDFLNGWDMDIQTAAVENCLYTDNGGVITACSYLTESDDVNFPRDCPEQPSVFDEPVHGNISALPGCNPITPGPGLAVPVVCPLNSHSLDPSNTSSISSTTSSATGTSVTGSPTVATLTSDVASSAPASSSIQLSSSTGVSTVAANPTTSTSAAAVPTASTTAVSSSPETSSTLTLDGTSSTLSTSGQVSISTFDPIPRFSASGDQFLTTISGISLWFTSSGQDWSWPGGVFVQVSSTSDSVTTPSTNSYLEASQTTPSNSVQTAEPATGASTLLTGIGSAASSAMTSSVPSGLAGWTELITITTTDWRTLTVTVSGNTPGNFVAVPTGTLTPSVSAVAGESQATTLLQSQTTVTVPDSLATISASTVTLSNGGSIDGGSSIATVTAITTLIPDTAIAESGTTVSVDGSTATQTESVLSSSGIFYTITGSTYTTFLSSEVGGGGTLYTITGSTYTTFASGAESNPGAQVPTTQAVSISTTDGSAYTSPGSTATTSPSTEDPSSSTDVTSTTTIFSTTTLYTTVTPESTTTLSMSSLQPTALGDTTLMTAPSATSAGLINTSSTSMLASSSVNAVDPITSLADDVATAFVTVTDPITDEITSTVDTTLTLSTATAGTTFFTIRGRKVSFIGN